jgi:hypothetical protein
MSIEERVKIYLEALSEEADTELKDAVPQVFFFRREVENDIDVLSIIENFDISIIPQDEWNEAIFDFSKGLESDSDEFDGFVFHAIASESDESDDRVLVFIYSYEKNEKIYTSYNLSFDDKKNYDSFLNFDIFSFQYGSIIN